MPTRYAAGAELVGAFGLEPGQDVLVAHAHPDDESVTTGHVINHMQANGINVHTALATDGTATTRGDRVLVEGGWRRIEAIRAQWELGVPLSQQHYLGLEDGELGKGSFDALVGHLGTLLARYNFAAIFTPGEEGIDGHIDHLAVHQAILLAAGNRAVSPPIWGLTRSLGDIAVAAGRTKIKAIPRHITQYPYGVETDILRPYDDLIFSGERYDLILPAESAGYAILGKIR